MRYYFGKKHLCVIAVVLLLGTLTACESSQTDIPSQTEKEGSSNLVSPFFNNKRRSVNKKSGQKKLNSLPPPKKIFFG